MSKEPMAPNWQMMRLRDMLDREGIPWHDASDHLFCRTQSDEVKTVYDEKGRPRDHMLFSVVCGPYSYGGREDLLEVLMAGSDEPVGYLDAERIMQMVLRWRAWDGRYDHD